MSKAATKEQLQSTALRAQGYAADVAAAASEAIQAVEASKADLATHFTATMTASEWVEETSDDTEGESLSLEYPYYYDITASVTENDRADIAIEPASLYNARACGFCPTTQTLEGTIRVRAQYAPEGDITGQCWITKGANE